MAQLDKAMKISPSKQDILSLNLPPSSVTPLYTTLPADTLTPVTAYWKLTSGTTCPSFLFESISGGEIISRYSLLGSNPRKITTCKNIGDPIQVLKSELGVEYVPHPDLAIFCGGAVGVVAYDCIEYFEPSARNELRDTLETPDAVFMMCDSVVVFDHLKCRVLVISLLFSSSDMDSAYDKTEGEIRRITNLLEGELPELPEADPAKHEWTSNTTRERYAQNIARIKNEIEEGNVIQVVPSRRLSSFTAVHPFTAYRKLRSINPSPYMFYIVLPQQTLVGASPGVVRVTQKCSSRYPITLSLLIPLLAHASAVQRHSKTTKLPVNF